MISNTKNCAVINEILIHGPAYFQLRTLVFVPMIRYRPTTVLHLALSTLIHADSLSTMRLKCLRAPK